MRHPRTTLALAALLSSALAGSGHAAGSVAQWAFDRTDASCLGALQGDSVDWDGGARCLGDRLGGLLVDEAARLLTGQGRRVFGEHFSLVHRLSWSPLGQGLAGELDAVIPLGGTPPRFRGSGVPAGAGAAEAFHGRALFLQQGVTRWTDAHGLRRHDLRLGTAVRFALPHLTGADVLGATALVQENAERGHQRLVLGADYAGRWGQASLQHYLPTTDWRPGRPGHEERAAGGTELSVRFALTTTLSLDTAMGRWERGDAGRSTLDGRLGLGWTPHPSLRFDAGTGLGPGAHGGAFRLSLNVPFGGPRPRAKWEGFGTFALAGGATAADL